MDNGPYNILKLIPIVNLTLIRMLNLNLIIIVVILITTP